MKILITGGTSKLGMRVMEYGRINGYDVLGVNLSSPFLNSELDLRNEKSVNQLFIHFKPNYVVHCAALTSADSCEVDIDNCNKINVTVSKLLAKASHKCGARIIGISSDYVFDGKNGPYDESSATNPINEYGRAKLKGEELLSKYCPNSLSIRTCVLYDWNKKPRRENFLVWLVNKLESNQNVKIVNDQYATPTFIPQLAEVIIQLLKTEYKGIINVCGSELLSRYEFSVKVADLFGLNSSLITKCNSSEFNQKAARPLKGGLSVKKVQNYLNREMYSCDEGLIICKQLKEQKYKDNYWPIKK